MCRQMLKLYSSGTIVWYVIVSSSSSTSHNSNSSRHAYDQQIPTEQNKEQTQNTIKKQDQVPAERKDDQIVTNFPEAAATGRILMHVGFTADKNKIIQFVQK